MVWPDFVPVNGSCRFVILVSCLLTFPAAFDCALNDKMANSPLTQSLKGASPASGGVRGVHVSLASGWWFSGQPGLRSQEGPLFLWSWCSLGSFPLAPAVPVNGVFILKLSESLRSPNPSVFLLPGQQVPPGQSQAHHLGLLCAP